jgi:hypothetical protein
MNGDMRTSGYGWVRPVREEAWGYQQGQTERASA